MTLTSQERAQAEHDRQETIRGLQFDIDDATYEISALRENIEENNEKVEELRTEIQTLVFKNRMYAKELVSYMGLKEGYEDDLHDIETISAETLAE